MLMTSGLELTGVGVDEAGLIRQPGDDLDARADQRADHFAERPHVLADVELFRLQGLPPRERQQLAGQFGGAGHAVRNRLDVALPPRLRQVRPPQQVDGSADHRQQIVEIMGDAAGELPQRLQPLAVLQRFLGLGAFCRFGMKGVEFAAAPALAGRTTARWLARRKSDAGSWSRASAPGSPRFRGRR